MTQRIWKFPLAIRSSQRVVAPYGTHAQILSVQMQGDHPCIWAIVDPDEQRKETLSVQIVGTGHEVPRTCGNKNYIGTVQGDGYSTEFTEVGWKSFGEIGSDVQSTLNPG